MAQPNDLQVNQKMNVWWSKTPLPGNFGDILTPYILNHYGIKHQYENLNKAYAISTGSIIRFARDNMQVLGSGVISRNDKLNPNAKYLFVRGPITAQMLKEQCGIYPEIHGDPALLLPRIFERDIKPIHDVRLIAHYVDLPEHQNSISTIGNPLKVLREIWACKKVMSSSLHGIVAAHAYGIPAAWVKLSDKLTGDDVKFHDYAQSVGMDEMPLNTYTLPRYNDASIHSIMQGLS